jgi:acetyl esterase/lipase
MRDGRLRVAGAIGVCALMLTGCTSSGASPTPTSPQTSTAADAAPSTTPTAIVTPPSTSTPTSVRTSTAGAPVTADYLPGLAAEIRVHDETGPASLVVLVPGGGWSSANWHELLPLAELLTASGATTAVITYSTTTMGAVFPQPVNDVACAVRWSAERATAMGHPPSRIVLVGHSAGGHLATLVALSGDEFGGACAEPAVKIDGVVGLAGVYDTTWDIDVLNAFFGGVDSADGRGKGSPVQWARAGDAPDGLRVLLVHGNLDNVVLAEQSRDMADALAAAGIDHTLELLRGEDHMTVIDIAVVGPVIERWLSAFPSAPG